MLSLIIIQAMAVYNHLSKKNEDFTSSLASTDKSAEYFSDENCGSAQVKPVSTKPVDLTEWKTKYISWNVYDESSGVVKIAVSVTMYIM